MRDCSMIELHFEKMKWNTWKSKMIVQMINLCNGGFSVEKMKTCGVMKWRKTMNVLKSVLLEDKKWNCILENAGYLSCKWRRGGGVPSSVQDVLGVAGQWVDAESDTVRHARLGTDQKHLAGRTREGLHG